MTKLKQFCLFLLHAIMCPVGALILRGKRRCGFLDLGKDVTVVGTIVGFDPGGGDGDVCFNVVTDSGYEWLRFYKDRDTTESIPGTLHCEFMPCAQFGELKKKLDAVVAPCQEGHQPRVKITGRWSYDGVHTSNFMNGDGLTFKEVWSCLLGHATNEQQGWTEIHPATDIELL